MTLIPNFFVKYEMEIFFKDVQCIFFPFKKVRRKKE